MNTSYYANLPRPFQNLACSIYGLRQRRQMYGGNFKNILADLLENQNKSRQSLEELQVTQLKSMLVSALSTDFYNPELLSNSIANIKRHGLAILGGLPLLEKESLRKNTAAFYSKNISEKDCISTNTSGTTGTPLRMRIATNGFSYTWAAMERMRMRAGVSMHDRRVSFTGKPFVPRHETSKFWRYDIPGNRLLCSVYHLNPKTIDKYIEAIRAFRPKFIDGYPSCMATLAHHMLERRIAPFATLIAAFPTAETLARDTREKIENGLGAKVYNQYGSSEMCCHIAECEHGSLHISPEIGIVEVLDSNGETSKPGESGEIVLTGLANNAMPLIRYRIGDIAVAECPNKICRCGLQFPMIREIIGRQDDLIITSDGRKLPIMNYHVFKVANGIKEGQLIQHTTSHFSLNYVRDTSTKLDLTASILALKERVGDHIEIDLHECDSVERTQAGKFRGVISMIEA